MGSPVTGPAEGVPTPPTAPWKVDLATFVGSRVLVLCVAWVSVFDVEDTAGRTLRRLVGVLSQRWDAEYYLRIAAVGYPNVLPVADDTMTHHWGFYPLYAWLVRAVGLVLPLDVGALLLNAVAGAAGALLLGRWLRRRLSTEQAAFGVVAFSFWTQSYFFTYAYAEAVYLVLLCLALLLLDREDPLPWRASGVAALLGLTIGLCRPYAVVVAAAAVVGVMWRVPRGKNWLRDVLRHPNVWAASAFGAGVVLSTLYVWYGQCRLRTGVWENCTGRAWEVAWGVGTSSLPRALAHDVAELWNTQPLGAWHLVRLWELGAWACAVGMLVYAVRHARTLGVVPVALAVLPLVTNLTTPFIRSVPRYMATTPTLFLLLGMLERRPVARVVVLAVVVVLHIFSGWATAVGVWQSF